jgi:hypothetical protein
MRGGPASAAAPASHGGARSGAVRPDATLPGAADDVIVTGALVMSGGAGLRSLVTTAAPTTATSTAIGSAAMGARRRAPPRITLHVVDARAVVKSSARLALCGANASLRLTGLRDADGVRSFTRHAASEPADERQAGAARGLRHVRLADQARDVADQTRPLALVRDLIMVAAAPFPRTRGPDGVEGLDRKL